MELSAVRTGHSFVSSPRLMVVLDTAPPFARGWHSRRVLAWEILCIAVVAALTVVFVPTLVNGSTPVLASGAAAAAVLVYALLRRALKLSRSAAVIGALTYICHPMVLGRASNRAGLAAAVCTILPPLALLLSRSARHPGWVAFCVLLSGVVVLGSMVDRTGCIVAALVCLLWPEWFERESGSSLRARFRSTASRALVMAAVVSIAYASLIAATGGIGTSSSAASNPTPAYGAITPGPLAWFDRNGLFASAMRELPARFAADSGSFYLSWVVVGLCLAAVWPGSMQISPRWAARCVLIAMWGIWVVRGPESLHRQWLALFAAATVRNQLSAFALNMLGIATVVAALLPAVTVAAAERSIRRSSRASFTSIFGAIAIGMAWWACAMPEPCATVATLVWSRSIVFPTVVVLLLACGAACGVERVMHSAFGWRRVAVSIVAASLLAADHLTLNRESASTAPSIAHAPSTLTSWPPEIRRERAQASLIATQVPGARLP